MTDATPSIAARSARTGSMAVATSGSVGSMPCSARVSDGAALVGRVEDRAALRALRAGDLGRAGGEPVEQVLAVHADDGEAVAEHDEHEPHGDGEARAVGDDATDSDEHAGHRRR